MTPQERQLIDDLFDRLTRLEGTPRDPEAVRAINDGLQRAPHALYPLVQTVLVQDEALKRADARIRELESELGIEQPQAGAQQQGSFLDTMRDTLLGRREPQSSVPTVPRRDSPWNTRAAAAPPQAGPQGQPYGAPPAQPYGAPQGQPYAQPGQPYGSPMGGSFLGTAAAAAAGVVGGSLLANSFRNMFGGPQQQQTFGAYNQPGSTAPSGPSASDSDLARQAGIDDVGGGRTAASEDPSQRSGLFDVAQNDTNHDQDTGGDDFSGGDFDSSDA
jgi:hypothetical protein